MARSRDHFAQCYPRRFGRADPEKPMLFNSIEFAIYLPMVFGLYWLIPSDRLMQRNVVLLVASYVFYAWWSWKLLPLIILVSVWNYGIGIGLVRARASWKNVLLVTAIIGNLGVLGTFKYYNFFIENLSEAFTFFGLNLEPERLNLILPVGISFYVFQCMSYTIDVYRGTLEPSRNPVAFLTFVAFFPQLVAGPIERAKNLLPQFSQSKHFDPDQAVDGLRQILWGLFKKVVIADSCAALVNPIFADPASHSGSTLALGAVLFAFQIYGDFSGYSDIAIGTAKLFNFNLVQNFAYPYFARDIAEFWRRWHMSLTTWFRDYLYIPLGGSRISRAVSVRNTAIVFLVSGLWHGANWTFILWGALHALFFMPLLLTNSNRTHLEPIEGILPGPLDVLRMLRTFLLVDVAWIFFRADDVASANAYFRGIAQRSFFSMPDPLPAKLLVLIMVMLAVEWLSRRDSHGLAVLRKVRAPMPVRWAAYLALVAALPLFGGTSDAFIYFQF
jgi:alginate O-acetyltransferase complex protein AlgI